ncbi:hypothetical protein, partial [Secundilactobacillus kimchicus]|uniref:hypothetical protein n=1 Tax=Secundilactobacillus kimchicus TaxID=528209 RepID=UPI000B0B2B43
PLFILLHLLRKLIKDAILGLLFLPIGLLFGGLPFLLSLPLLIGGFLLAKAIADALALGLAGLLTALPFLLALPLAFLGHLLLLGLLLTPFGLLLLGLKLLADLAKFLIGLALGWFLFPLLLA